MKRLLFIILLFPCVLSAQDGVIDSLKLALKNAKHDTTRCNILGMLAETASDEEWPLFNEQRLKLAEKNSKTTSSLKPFYLRALAGAFINIGLLANQHGDISKALEYYHKSLKIQEEIKNKRGVAICLNNIGVIYNQEGDIAKALQYYSKSLKIQEEIKDKHGMAYSLKSIGAIYHGQGDIPKALDYYHKSLKIREEIKDSKGIAQSLESLGVIYEELGDIPKALDCYQKSLKRNEEVNDKVGIGYNLNAIGVIYSKQGLEKKIGTSERDSLLAVALDYYNKSLKIREEIQDKQGIALSLKSIGLMYKNKSNMAKALEYFLKSLKIHEEINDKLGTTYTLNYVANAMFELGNSGSAQDFALRSLKTAKELGYPQNIRNAAKTLKRIYEKNKNFKEALEMYELEIQMNDSINNTETKKASIKKEFQYEYEKKAAADSVKNAEEQKVKNALLTAQQAQLTQEKTQRWALYGGLVLVIAFLGFVFNRFRVTQKQKVIIEQQKVLVDNAFSHLEEKNKEVMDSIHYAKRIQTALLTSEKYIERKLNELNS